MNWKPLIVQLSHATTPSSQASLLDVGVSLAVLGLVVAALWGHGVVFWGAAAPKYDRLKNEQGGVLFGRTLMQAGYWLLQPVGRTLLRRGITPGSITVAGLVLAAAAAAAIIFGRMGLAGLALLCSASCDALDGMVARFGRSSSEGGAALDAIVDRVEEVLVFSALALAGRQASWMVTLSIAALIASLMNSYVSAKAEVFRTAIPGGRMRRGERSAWIILGSLLVPLTQAVSPLTGVNHSALPLVLCVAVVAIGAGWSAVARARALVNTLGQRTVGMAEQDRRMAEDLACHVHQAESGREIDTWLVESKTRIVPAVAQSGKGELPQR